MDYKEYSRLRSIARKRIERAAAAGAGEYIRIPTVKEIKQMGHPEQYLRAVKDFLQDPGSTLTAARATKEQIPKIELPLSPEEKRKRRNEQKRRSKAKRAVEKAAKNEKEARKQVGYLRALETVTKKWKKAGIDVSDILGILSPARAKSFVNYMEYRFIQGDFNAQYVIDTFVRDFGMLTEYGYNTNDIKRDFDIFLEKEKIMKKGKRKAAHGSRGKA